MILDVYEQREDSINIKALVQRSVDIFAECFDVTNVDLASPKSVHGFFSAGSYDIEKVRHFYLSKESAFRKRIKEIGLTVSISRGYYYSMDEVNYNFYIKRKSENSGLQESNFLYSLNVYYEEKNIDYQTYKELTYDISTDPCKSNIRKQLSNIKYDSRY